VNVLLIAGKP